MGFSMLIAHSSQDLVATLFVAFPSLHVDPVVAEGLLFEFCLFCIAHQELWGGRCTVPW
jgi:hypothetical protein